MDRTKIRKALLAAALMGVTTVAATGSADAHQGGYGPGYGMGPGMMGGYGPGPGYGYGMGPGMMGGYGMGPGMMGGYGPGYGMGPGMMGGYGPGYGMLNQLDLSSEQRSKLSTIQEELAKKHWELAGRMREESYKLGSLMNAENRDRSAITAEYRKLQELRQQGFQLRLDAREKIDGVLTAKQKDELRRFAPSWAPSVE